MVGTRINSRVANELLIALERDSKVPLHQQIEASLRQGIRSGRLRMGTALPSTRGLAAVLGVSRGVVVEAYEQLLAEGYLISRAGGATQIAIGPQPAPAASSRAAPLVASPAQGPLAIDFGYGRADVANFPRAAWLRSIQRVFTEAPNERFAYLSGRGVPELHEALVDYLNRVRATSAGADNVIICSGYGQAVSLLIGVLARKGAKRLAVEDPSSNDDARPLAAAVGMEVVGIPVGDEGIRIDVLEQTDADALILTPSHQWPTGAVLSAQGRAAVLRWARRRNALVIEDDYDAEYRYDRAPIGAMQGLAPDLVAYAGTASKTLVPGLRLGWLIVPDRLVDDIQAAKVLADRGSPVIDQLTFADFLSRGEFDRHLRRMRPVYRRRRDTLLQALHRCAPDLVPTGISAGLQLVTWLPDDLKETELIAAAAQRGLGVYGLAPYRLTSAHRDGLIFGYSTLNEHTIAEGIELLATTIGDLRKR